ncbi:Thioredoxin [Thalassovita gelatinovora]|uniref:Thioredoxin n=1 Tax=Thalassovita gelatinovora TaxID=53501 RepID=A0A0P1F6K2_THAGE|nr:thioredoxin family protein [Thalassovita gelatinovora]QIZ80940.1 thioredoxin family protein [Thalassovita gelatinovora]CUH63456.1 Thioredoxin [Thalassovita gelatinovora]SEQ67246.1 Thioredoxin [Thalassovita gelatinovora]
MKRRDFIILGTAGTVLAGQPVRADPLQYSDGLLQSHLAAGDTVFLDFKASWCSTCAAQDRVLTKLKAGNADYEAHITFIDVDWDAFGQSDLVKRLRIPRRSTLVVLKGDQEYGRIVAQTGTAQIQQLMDGALALAQSS